ncbi:DUF2283 domain-containing protein [Actinomadura scrupuli]|uniref:DUF2283 domain-containing protein n=1 Tax=Actinomadura scrupuli TaxID=559629 RepID=UPI003D995176
MELMSGPVWHIQSNITVDVEADALYIEVAEGVGEGEAVSNESFALNTRRSEVVFDFDAGGRLLGIEILGVKDLLRPGSVK